MQLTAVIGVFENLYANTVCKTLHMPDADHARSIELI